MGKPLFPYYGEDVGSALETHDRIESKVKNGKFTKKDLDELKIADNVIYNYMANKLNDAEN